MDSPLFSIVTISYNQVKYLRQTIESVIFQTYKNYEYIIVDAGSTDGSRDIILEYKDYFKKIIFEEDNGPADGLNKGFSFAKGDVFCYLNSDDLLFRNAFELVSYYFRNYNTDIVCGNGYQIDENNFINKPIITDKLSFIKLLYNSVTFTQPSLFFKSTAFYEVNHFNSNNYTCWDYEILVEMLYRKFKIVNISEFISYFRIHNTSISGTGKLNEKYLGDMKRIYKKYTDNEIGYIYNLYRFFFRILKIISKPDKIRLLFNNDAVNTKVNLYTL